MHEKSPTGVESHNQVLAPATDLCDTLSDELTRDDRRVERPDEACIVNLDVLEACAGQHGRESPADGFDLRQLGHLLSLGPGAPVLGRVSRAKPSCLLAGVALSARTRALCAFG